MILVNRFTGKPVSASGEVADRLLGAGFKKQEPEVVVKKIAAKRGRPKKDTSKSE